MAKHSGWELALFELSRILDLDMKKILPESLNKHNTWQRLLAICVVGGMYRAVALLHMLIFIPRPELRTDLFFALMCTCDAPSIFSEIGA